VKVPQIIFSQKRFSES